MYSDYHELENIINIIFSKNEYIDLAFIHPSYANEHNLNHFQTNQRLEFLGDAVLELVTSDFLYNNYFDYSEGKLTKLRSKIVCEESLASVARELKLYDYLKLGNGESIVKVKNNNSIMCDTIEALIGAIYLEHGIHVTSEFIKKFILTDSNINKSNDDYKSILQEYINSINKSIKYELVYEKGPDHNKLFSTDVYIDDEKYGNGIGKSKKESEQLAAKNTLIVLKKIKCS